MTTEPRATIAARIETDFARRLQALRDAAARTTTRADDEAIHDVRVATRRLGAAVGLWRGVVGSDVHRAAARRLRRLRRRLGAARELEVHVASLRARMSDETLATRLALEELVRRLVERRDRARRRAARRTRPRRIARLMVQLGEARGALAAMGVRPDPPAERTAGESAPSTVLASDPLAEARRRVARRAAVVRRRVAGALEHRDDDALHRARIAVKQWRYAAEALRAATGDDSRETERELKAVQESLGDIHDAAALRDLLRRVAARRDPEGSHATAATLRTVAERLEAERVAAVTRFATLADALPDATADADRGAKTRGTP
jgi:CHAD domain-containing protein